MERVPVTATVTTYARIDQTLATIRKILACRPAPDEVLVHVDAGQDACAEAIRRAFSDIPIIISRDAVGPGGGRNKLMAVARNVLVANFDDDSYPYDPDFFARAVEIFTRFPQTSVVSGMVIHRHQAIPAAERKIAECGNFSGGAVVFQRDDLIEAGGYVPLPIAYGAEEEDLALRLFDRRKVIMFSPWLRVFHDTTLEHHNDPIINAHVIANIGMLAFLRYPSRYWFYGFGQVANRVRWCVSGGRRRGILRGLVLLPIQILKHRALRAPVSPQAIRAKRKLRKFDLRDF
jgi:glycosyltransferase involved in cell wall biosynthesis